MRGPHQFCAVKVVYIKSANDCMSVQASEMVYLHLQHRHKNPGVKASPDAGSFKKMSPVRAPVSTQDRFFFAALMHIFYMHKIHTKRAEKTTFHHVFLPLFHSLHQGAR